MSAGRLTLAFSLLLAMVCAAPAVAAPGDLDPTFGTYGKFLSSTQDNTSVDSVVVRPGGSIVAAGTTLVQAPVFGFQPVLFGLTPDGKPDPSFGQNGQLILPSGFGSAWVALQGDRIIAAANSGGHLTVYRLLGDGQLDPSFGSAGIADTGLPGQDVRVAVANDGKIVVAATTAPVAGVVVARLLPDGQSFDPSFGGGVVYGDANRPDASAQAIAAGPGDKVTVLSGQSSVLRFAGDGTLDSSFGSGGEVSDHLGGSINDLTLRPDGSPLLAGVTVDDSSYQGVLSALTQTGDSDPSFALHGTAVVPLPESDASALAIDSRGRTLVMGSGAIRSTSLITFRLFLARYQPDGALDTTFGSDGLGYARFDTGDIVAAALAFTSDGRIVAAVNRDTGDRYPFYTPGLMRFLVAPGPRDADADGVSDDDDRCQYVSAAGHHGCPSIERQIALHHNHHGVKGRLRADQEECDDAGEVSIYAPRRGRDELLRTASIAYDGRFTARAPREFKGDVYALAKRSFLPDNGLCARARSKSIAVR